MNDLYLKLENLRTGELLDRIAGDRPLLPAAGSALVLTGAVAAAMGGFVARIALRHAGPDAIVRSEISKTIARFDSLKERCSAMITEDVEAYRKVMREKDDTGTAHVQMTKLYLEMAENGFEMLELIESLLPKIHPPTRADAAAVFHLARAFCDGARNILYENSGMITDHSFAEQVSGKADSLYRRYDAICSRLESWVQKTF